MIDKENLEKYQFPNPINFEAEENRLRKQNMNILKIILDYISQFPEMIEDIDELKERTFKEKYQINQEKIYKEIKNFSVKVNNFAEKFNLNKHFLIERIKFDDVLSSNFITDFKKQNPYEPFVETYFKFLERDLHFIYNFKHLPVDGPQAIYVYNGLICDESIKSSVAETPPSVDFVWEYSFKTLLIKFYASHKYTSGCGTAQKNQMKDLETFLHHANSSALTNNDTFIAIMDGNYYTDNAYPNFRGNPKPRIIDHIRATRENVKCKIATSLTLVSVIIDVVVAKLNTLFPQDSDAAVEIEKLQILRNSIRS